MKFKEGDRVRHLRSPGFGTISRITETVECDWAWVRWDCPGTKDQFDAVPYPEDDIELLWKKDVKA